MREQPCRRQCALLGQAVVGGVLVIRSAHMPLGFVRLVPVQPQQPKIVAKRNGNVGGHCDGRHTGYESLGRKRRQSVKLSGARWTIGDAGVLMHMFKGSKEPQLVLPDWAAESPDVVLS